MIGAHAMLSVSEAFPVSTKKLFSELHSAQDNLYIYQLDISIPRGGNESIFLDIRPVNGENLTTVLMPRAYWKVLNTNNDSDSLRTGNEAISAYI